jgi:hypothetical protein
VDLEIAAARLTLGKLTSEEALFAASAALDSGVYSESLGLLAYEEPVWSQVGPLFERALKELTIPIPSRQAASLVLAREYARRIVAGEVSPYEGARRICWEVANEPDADPSLTEFVGLASEWEDAPAHRAYYEGEIVDVAQRLVMGSVVGSRALARDSAPPAL